MSNAALTSIARVAGAAALTSLGAALHGAWHRIGDYRRHRAAIQKLHTLDDHMLKDIGVRREDIEVAVRGRHRRT